MSQKIWTDEAVCNELRRITNALNLNRMPSRNEIDTFRGDSRVTNAMSKYGGFKKFAELVGLPLKESDTKTGQTAEEKAFEILKRKGFCCERTSTKHPYDILVEGCVKVDVKSSHLTHIRDYPCYSFRLAKPQQTCDVYVACCLNEDDSIEKTYVIPAHIVSGQVQICVGPNSKHYKVYEDRYEYIDDFVKAFKEVGRI